MCVRKQMLDWCEDEYPWLCSDDPWFGRSYIGDEYDALIVLPPERPKLIATFYDSDDETKEEFDLSDISDDDEASVDECESPSVCIRLVLQQTVKTNVNNACRHRLHSCLYTVRTLQ
jgi:hypothetical protein